MAALPEILSELQRRRHTRSMLDAEIYALEERLARMVKDPVTPRPRLEEPALSRSELIQRRNELNRLIDRVQTQPDHSAPTPGDGA